MYRVGALIIKVSGDSWRVNSNLILANFCLIQETKLEQKFIYFTHCIGIKFPLFKFRDLFFAHVLIFAIFFNYVLRAKISKNKVFSWPMVTKFFLCPMLLICCRIQQLSLEFTIFLSSGIDIDPQSKIVATDLLHPKKNIEFVNRNK